MLGNPNADIIFLSGAEDISCGTEHDEHARTILEGSGHESATVESSGANQWEVGFHDQQPDGTRLTLPADHPAGQQTVQTILDAIAAART